MVMKELYKSSLDHSSSHLAEEFHLPLPALNWSLPGAECSFLVRQLNLGTVLIIELGSS